MQSEAIKVLLVEDNPADARIVQEELSENLDTFFELITAETLADALSKIAESEVDLILLDLSLPDSSGLETFSNISKNARSIPIVVLSGMKDEALALAAVGKGAQDYLVKNEIDCQLLVKTIKYSIERAKALEKIHESEGVFLSVLERINEYVSVLNLNGELLYTNPQFKRIVGEENSSNGSSFFNIVHEDDRNVLQAFIEKLIQSKQENRLDYRIIPKSGDYKHFESSFVLSFDLKNNPDKIIVISRDVTEAKKEELKLRKATNNN